MISVKIKKTFPFLIIFGLLLMLTGAGFAYVAYQLNVFNASLFILGFLIFLLCFIFSHKPFHRRKYFDKTSRTFFIRLLIAFFTLTAINGAVLRYDLRWDLTQNKQHTLSSLTTNTLKNLQDNILITAFYVGIPPKYLEDLLNEYNRMSNGHIQTEIVDPLVKIGYASQFGKMISADEKKVVVQSPRERKDIDFKDSPLTEESLTNAIIQVTRERKTIYFLTGHNEFDVENKNGEGYSQLGGLLENNNFTLKTLRLNSTEKIPGDCDLLVVAGPKNPLTSDEKNIIIQYLELGGTALFLIEATPLGTPERPLREQDKQKNPSLNDILNQWGVSIGDDVVVDLENYVGQDVGCPATKHYPPHKEIVNGLDYTFYIRPRSISMKPNPKKLVKTAPLVFTQSQTQSWAEKDKNLFIKYNPEEDIPGPIAIGAVIWEPKMGEKKKETRIIVFTDGDFITNNFIGQYSNAAMALNSIKWLVQSEYIELAQNKKIKVERLDLTSKQLRLIIVILWSLPILIAGVGGSIWFFQKSN